MSNVFFFRLHKLRRQQEQEQERRQLQQQRRLSGSSSLNGSGKRSMKMGRFRQLTRPSMHCPSLVDSNVLTMVPGRLFERPATMDPTDSLDYIALQIPRYLLCQHFGHNFIRLPHAYLAMLRLSGAWCVRERWGIVNLMDISLVWFRWFLLLVLFI